MHRRRYLKTLTAGLCATGLTGCRPAVPPVPPTAAPSPRRLEPTTPHENLAAFARLYGYVRFFHPTMIGETTDWRAFALAGCRAVRGVGTLGELHDSLRTLFGEVAPSVQLWIAPEPPPSPRAPPPRRDGVVYWQHLGFEGSPLTVYRPPYARVRVTPDTLYRRRFTERPSDDAVVEAALTGPLWARVPLVLSAQGEVAARADEPQRPAPESLARYDDATDPDIRAAAVVESWNVLRHFYPYQEEVEVDWGAALDEALVQADAAEDAEGLRRALEGLVARLHDGHGAVGLRRSGARTALPFALEIVEGKAVVVASNDPSLFVPGDVIASVDGVSTVQAIRDLADRFSGSEQWRLFRAAAWEFPRGPAGTSAQVVRVRGAARTTLTVAYGRHEPPVPQRPEALCELENGVMYVDLTRLEWSAIAEALPVLAAAPGVIFDLRGYPVHNDQLIDHLLREPESAQWMHVPCVIEPDGAVVAWQRLGWSRSPREPQILGHAAFLVSPAAISYAESMLSYVETHGLATLVGQTSAGANGDIVRVDTLGGVYLIFTGMRVTRHDGRRFHTQGVVPNVIIEPTIAALAAGRDEVLDAALAIVLARIEEAPPALPLPALPPNETKRN